MQEFTPAMTEVRKVSLLASELQGSEIIQLAGEIREKVSAGAEIYNFTVGDFDPAIFPIPAPLLESITKAYRDGHTNYPASNGIDALRKTLAAYIRKHQGLDYSPDEFLIASGGRPLIYSAFQAIIDPGEKVVFPVPSWNNNHYTTLTRGVQVPVETTPEQNFMPTAADLASHMADAAMIALCSPLNPTGTVFTESELRKICDLILAENKRREGNRKPLYLIYDQIYWQLCFGNTKHFDPVSLLPEMKPYTIYIDGISKVYAATGVRVGWGFGPKHIMDKMKSILGHVGAWAPKPEQVGTAEFMAHATHSDSFLLPFKEELHKRLEKLYTGFKELEQKGFPVQAIAPQAALYLTVKVELIGKIRPDGKKISSVRDTTQYLLEEAGLAMVPFSAFGGSSNNPWYRISVGTARTAEIPVVFDKLQSAIKKLQ
jgi:aspartate aminotransferase